MMKKRLYRLFQWLYKGVPIIRVTPSISFLSDTKKLAGKRILIIGGTRGLGLIIAQKLLSNGASVIIVGRNESTLKKASETLNGCPFIQFDITDINHFSDLIEQAHQRFQAPIDSLVYNASLYLHENSILEVSPDGFDQQFSTNLKAPYFLSKCFVSYLEKENISSANLLYISSEMGLYCTDIPYGLGKASLNSFVAGLSRRLITKGIRVNAIAPGTLSNETSDIKDNDIYRKYSCGQRFIMPEEVAEVSAFLLSDAANCISGAVIPCDQGNHYRCDW